MDLRWLVGALFAAFASALIFVGHPVWATFPAGAGVCILVTKLQDEWRRGR